MAFATPILFLFLFLFLFIFATSNAFDPCPSDASDLSILHIYSKCSPFAPPSPAPVMDTVISMAKRDPARLAYLLTEKVYVSIGSGQQIIQTGNYVVRVKVGTPGQQMYMVMDTSSDTAFVPCTACTGCSKTVFSPQLSTTFLGLDCSVSECAQVRGQACTTVDGPCLFNQSYGGDSSFFANLVLDSLSLGRDVVPKFPFGCIDSISGGSIPPQGLLGLGRGSMSLISQTASLYKSTFSYCLPSFKSYYFSGSLKIGPVGQPKGIRTTPLLQNPHRPSLYYVNLTAISVNKKYVIVPPDSFAFNPATGAGTILDSGTMITRFVPAIYAALRDTYRSGLNGSISSLGSFDSCFDSELNPAAPTVTLHFEGLNLTLPMENTLIHSSATSLACLAMAAAPNNVNSVVNVIANLQQQNLRFLFDIPNSRVGIARELCN
ncbi:aspartyl protease AED3 [Aristolochia californica]|uniref:aspartyl protease AED3 n=1 Tax=Aristolochia californica TaxID=171875 RepID=UPI0035DB925B